MPPTPPKPPPPSGLSITPQDILYCLFRYKWVVILFAMLGFAGSAAVYFLTPPVYQSEARLLIRYVLETRNTPVTPEDAQVRSPDARGENIINSELEMLTSLDLAFQVATNLGPERILAKAGGGNEIGRAAGMVRKGLSVEVPRRSNVIRVTYQHPDQEMVAPILRSLIESYQKKHVEVHRGVGIINDFVAQQRDAQKNKLAVIEDELKSLKTRIGLISLQESRAAYIAEISRIREELFTAQAELAERGVAVKEMGKLTPSQNEADAAPYGVTLEQLNTYKTLCSDLNSLITQHRDMIGKYNDTNPAVEEIKTKLAAAEKDVQKMEQAHPKLKDLGIPKTGLPPRTVDLSAEMARTLALEAKIATLGTQLTNSMNQAALLSENEAIILKLERERQMAEENLRRLQNRLDEAMSDAKVTNINELQSPTPGGRDTSQLLKMVAIPAGAGLGGGIGLALLFGLFLSRSIRSSGELQGKLHLPVFLSIPFTGRNGHSRSSSRAKVTASASGVDSLAAAPNGSSALALWQPEDPMHVFNETLRDRLIGFFESKGMNHKPKLVAVTSCHRGAGVTTIAAGLAASLSETGDGNVLLVDMTQQGSAHPFCNGKPAFALPDMLESDKRDAAQVHENLFIASASGENGGLALSIPKRFSHLVPKMKASDYDYIIFDMPPVSQTSITPRLAGYMDMVMMVVEGEKTNPQSAERAAAMLAESGVHMAAVLNKSRNYLPKWLSHDS